MPKTIYPQPVTVYTFDELCPDAQKKALENTGRKLADNSQEFTSDDFARTRDAWNRISPLPIVDCEVTSYRAWVQTPPRSRSEWIEHGTEPPEGHRAWVWLLNWCHDNIAAPSEKYNPKGRKAFLAGDWRAIVAALENCPLSGTYADFGILDPIHDALTGNPRKCPTPDAVFRTCAERWARQCSEALRDDEDATTIRERFMEDLESFQFLADGTAY